MKKRLLSFLLSALLAAGSLVSCSDSGANTEDTGSGTETQPAATESTTAADSTADLTSAEARRQIPDNLPDKTFNGRNFLVGTTPSKEYEIISEEMTGEGTNDSVYNRNVKLEERFDVKIAPVLKDAPYDDVKTNVLSGTYAYDLVGFINFLAYTPIVAGVLFNWYDVPYVDLTQPWHNRLANDGATINNKLFAANSDLSISTLLYTYGMFFNYKIMENYGYTSADLYNIVFEGN